MTTNDAEDDDLRRRGRLPTTKRTATEGSTPVKKEKEMDESEAARRERLALAVVEFIWKALLLFCKVLHIIANHLLQFLVDKVCPAMNDILNMKDDDMNPAILSISKKARRNIQRSCIRVTWMIIMVLLFVLPLLQQSFRSALFQNSDAVQAAIDLPPEEQAHAIKLLREEQERQNMAKEPEVIPPEISTLRKPLFPSFVEERIPPRTKRFIVANTTQPGEDDEDEHAPWATAQFRVCVIVRTYYKQANTLRQLLDSIIVPKELASTLASRAFIIETDKPNATNVNSSVGSDDYPENANSFSELLEELAQRSRERAGDRNAVRQMNPPFESNKLTYGYDVTDWVFQRLLKKFNRNQCTHFMFTNGDNYYLPNLFRMLESNDMLLRYGFIAWDFLSRYSGKVRRTSIKRDWIDLGSYIVSAKWLRTQKDAAFLPPGVPVEEIEQPRLWTADYHFAYLASRNLDASQIKVMRRVLFIHN